jgi:signal peptidase I
VTTQNKIWKNGYFKTTIAIVLIVAIVLGLFFGLEATLNTPSPFFTVESGSMSIPYDASDNFWASILHPFDRTLSIGDIIILEGVKPANLSANYPNSDIIVYRDPDDLNTLIVHRIVSKQEINGTWYFQTKGDGNGQQWPATPSPGEYDSHTIWYSAQYSNTGIPQNYVVGKVVMRIPWFGWITLFMRGNSLGLPIIIVLILLLVVVEFIIPVLRQKKPQESNSNPSKVSSVS